MAAGSPSAEILKTWQQADLVCFDVDSTLITEESLDEIAAFVGKGDEVASITKEAMSGAMPFRQALQNRLEVMKLSKQALERFKRERSPVLTKGIDKLVQALQERNTAVALVSGGFREVIEPIADSLGIPLSHVYANRFKFQPDGSFEGFDSDELTSEAGGKAEAVRRLKSTFGYGTVVMVGDGATDLEARREGGADAFIAFGGIVHRPTVAAEADWAVTAIQELIDAFE